VGAGSRIHFIRSRITPFPYDLPTPETKGPDNLLFLLACK
jgi:hypothetical protein